MSSLSKMQRLCSQKTRSFVLIPTASIQSFKWETPRLRIGSNVQSVLENSVSSAIPTPGMRVRHAKKTRETFSKIGHYKRMLKTVRIARYLLRKMKVANIWLAANANKNGAGSVARKQWIMLIFLKNQRKKASYQSFLWIIKFPAAKLDI